MLIRRADTCRADPIHAKPISIDPCRANPCCAEPRTQATRSQCNWRATSAFRIRIVRVVCSLHPCAAAASSECSFALPRRATSYRSCRVQSAPVCSCSFVGVLVRTPSSRDFVSFVSCAVRTYVQLQLRRSARPHSLVARLRSPRDRMLAAPVCAATASSECFFALPRRATLYRSVVCSLHPCAAAASSECSSALPRRATLYRSVVCSLHPCAAAASSECSSALPRRATLYRSYRVQSAPMCSCSFVGVLVRTPSSRDHCRPRFVCVLCALRMSRYNPISFRFSFRTYFVFRSSQLLVCAAFPHSFPPPPSLPSPQP